MIVRSHSSEEVYDGHLIVCAFIFVCRFIRECRRRWLKRGGMFVVCAVTYVRGQ